MPDYSQYLKGPNGGEGDDNGPGYEPGRPTIFLVLAAVMMLLAVGVYAFEADFYHLFGRSTSFVVALSLLVGLGLLFLMFYATPGLGNRILRRGNGSGRIKRSAKTSGTGVTYNVFQGETLGDVAMSHRRRKTARHLRKELSRITPTPAELVAGKKVGDPTDDTDSDKS